MTGKNIKDRTKMAAIRTMLDMKKTDIITDSKKEAKLESEEENEALCINCTISTLQAQTPLDRKTKSEMTLDSYF